MPKRVRDSRHLTIVCSRGIILSEQRANVSEGTILRRLSLASSGTARPNSSSREGRALGRLNESLKARVASFLAAGLSTDAWLLGKSQAASGAPRAESR